jgi:1L-myo-inositol 1-phosphate cytidylyltransferase
MRNNSVPPQPDAEISQAVILAAGQGQRLREGNANSALKPLTPVLGVSLLERAVRSCQAAGISECYVVVGYGKEQIGPYVAELAARYDTHLHTVDNPCWPEGNGTSALVVEPYIHGPFLLLMCDHIFDVAILLKLMTASRRTDACLLAVDRRIAQIFDREDATKVRLDGRLITAIGKDLTCFDAIDTGLFLCRAALFEALARARVQGDGSLSGGIRQLIASAMIQAMPIGDRFWLDIDTPESLAYAECSLLKAPR